MGIKNFSSFNESIYFEAYNNEVKLELSKDDCDDILDLFQTQIADKYKMVFFPIDTERDHHHNMRTLPIADEFFCNYAGGYNKYNKDFEVSINISNKLNINDFTRDMKKFKDRLVKFGFEVKGHYWINKPHFHSTEKIKRYSLSAYKPMFPTKKKTPLTQ